ncbi:MAG: hypothetical protein H3C49_02020 [Alphaproteobacteria bacterium]|nr:hypothetical protein [Alphaproteobacteria bacterium]
MEFFRAFVRFCFYTKAKPRRRTSKAIRKLQRRRPFPRPSFPPRRPAATPPPHRRKADEDFYIFMKINIPFLPQRRLTLRFFMYRNSPSKQYYTDSSPSAERIRHVSPD